MYYGLKQGQITPNIENKYVLKLIHLVAQSSKVTNTVLFLKRIFHQFSAFSFLLLVISECPKVHFVALRFILFGHLIRKAEFFICKNKGYTIHRLLISKFQVHPSSVYVQASLCLTWSETLKTLFLVTCLI